MGKVVIFPETTPNPIITTGKMAGVCYGSDINDLEKNYKRGIDCLESMHGRTEEFPQVYFSLEGYSIKFGREFYVHIGGAPSRLQSSTRYINYQNGFEYVVPPTIAENPEALEIFTNEIASIQESIRRLDALGIPKEDSSGLCPLDMTSTIVCRTNMRHLIEMSHQRLCNRAYWEYREFMNDLADALCNYSVEWKYVVENYFKPKCLFLGRCPEKIPCRTGPSKLGART